MPPLANKKDKDVFIYLIVCNSSNSGHPIEIVLWARFKDSRVSCTLSIPGDDNVQPMLRIAVLGNQERIHKNWERKNL